VKIITLTTDFGVADWFVGAMKGVILGLQPRAVLVDITHEIAPGDIRAGAFALAASHGYFPRGTIHVAVVDPGVGSRRGAIAVQTTNYFFVGPDNGVLSLALGREKSKAIHRIANEQLLLHPISDTFHGRDVFAPVAAHLSAGAPIQKLGPPIQDFLRLNWPTPRIGRNEAAGEIVYIDRFGNAITNVADSALSAFDRDRCEVSIKSIKRKRLCPVCSFYQAVPAGQPVAVFGSSGFLEIAVNGGSAAKSLRLKIGDRATVRQRRR
jgi:S-adenosylmethionine hydrolase